VKHKILFSVLALSWGYLTWHLTTTPNLVVAPENLLNTIMMMGGHFVFFGILSVLLSFNIATLPAIISSSVYGAIIELVQRNIPGRSMDPVDWILDTLGAIAFLAIMKKLNSYRPKTKA